MLKKRYDLWETGEYTYPMAFGFQPNIVSYLHEDTEKSRPCVIVVPGGGYRVVSPSEGEIVAKKFYDKGFSDCHIAQDPWWHNSCDKGS